MKATPLLDVKGLTVAFGRGRKRAEAVRSASFSVMRGETFGIVGESGSGKTTIGRAILRLYKPSSGEIRFKGHKISGKIPQEEARRLTKSIQMIFQDPMASLNERAKVDYIVGEGLANFEKLSPGEMSDRVGKALREVGLPRGFGSRYPHEFSGGQRQRIGIARAIAMNPEFIVADEPISALDVSIRAQVLNLLSRLQKERGLTYLFISHDLSVMRFACDRIASMYRGRILELAGTEALFSRPLHPYTKALLSAAPYPDPDVERGKRPISYDPSVHDYSVDAPLWREIEDGHFVYCSAKEESVYRKEAKRAL
jgi:oligopeptide transport system ATP-binding protein